MKVAYTYNGVDLKTYGVSVSKGRGFIGLPKRKESKKYEYPDNSGYVPDLAVPVYEARTITLDCYIQADNAVELTTKHNAFSKAMLNVTALVPFNVTIDATQVFSGSVHATEISELVKTFSEGKNIGTFTLTLVEPEPQI